MGAGHSLPSDGLLEGDSLTSDGLLEGGTTFHQNSATHRRIVDDTFLIFQQVPKLQLCQAQQLQVCHRYGCLGTHCSVLVIRSEYGEKCNTHGTSLWLSCMIFVLSRGLSCLVLSCVVMSCFVLFGNCLLVNLSVLRYPVVDFFMAMAKSCEKMSGMEQWGGKERHLL
jgi:hypothetical protein